MGRILRFVLMVGGVVLIGLVSLGGIATMPAAVSNTAVAGNQTLPAESPAVDGLDMLHGRTVAFNNQIWDSAVTRDIVMCIGFVVLMVIAIVVIAAITIVRLLLGGGGRPVRNSDEQEVRTLQEVHRGLEGLEKRVASLETILLSSSRQSGRDDDDKETV